MNIAQKYGVIGGLILGVLVFVNMLSLPEDYDFLDPSYIRTFFLWTLNTIVCIAVLYMSASERRKTKLGGYMTFGQGLGQVYATGLYVILVSTVISAVYFYVIDPDWFPYEPEVVVEYMEEKAGVDFPDQTKVFMEMQYEYITETTIFGRVFGNLIAFLILGLILGGILNKPNPNEIKF